MPYHGENANILLILPYLDQISLTKMVSLGKNWKNNED